MQGGDFLSGAAGGFFGSLGSSAFGAIAGEWATSAGGQVFFGALSGGIGAELTGGNFWQGAVTGGIVAGLNHLAHRQVAKFQIKKDLRAEFQETEMDPDSKASFEDHAELTENLPTLKSIKDKISYTVVENNKITTKGLVRETAPNTINVNLNRINNLLDYAFTLGHEMIHVFDLTYNGTQMLNVLGRNRIGRDLRTILMEYRAYQWEYNNGNNINVRERIGVDNYKQINKYLERMNLKNP
jgi:hypothetical protein